MKYFTTILALFSSLAMTSCNWFSNTSSPPYTVHHDFEVHCKHRAGTPRTGVAAQGAVIRIDPTQKGNGQEWDEFQIEVQEKVTTQSGSSWQTVTQTPWLSYPQSLSSVQQDPNQEYLVDFKNKLNNPSGFKNPSTGFNSFSYRLVLKGKWSNYGTPVVTQVPTDLAIEVGLIHWCTSPQIVLPQDKL